MSNTPLSSKNQLTEVEWLRYDVRLLLDIIYDAMNGNGSLDSDVHEGCYRAIERRLRVPVETPLIQVARHD